jgi:hypothetical protein
LIPKILTELSFGIGMVNTEKYRPIPTDTDRKNTDSVSPYRPESFDGIVKNKLPGELFFFFDPSEVPL